MYHSCWVVELSSVLQQLEESGFHPLLDFFNLWFSPKVLLPKHWIATSVSEGHCLWQLEVLPAQDNCSLAMEWLLMPKDCHRCGFFCVACNIAWCFLSPTQPWKAIETFVVLHVWSHASELASAPYELLGVVRMFTCVLVYKKGEEGRNIYNKIGFLKIMR